MGLGVVEVVRAGQEEVGEPEAGADLDEGE